MYLTKVMQRTNSPEVHLHLIKQTVTFNRVRLCKTAPVYLAWQWWIAQLDLMKTKPVSIFEAVFFSHQQNSSVLSHVSWVYIKLHLCSPHPPPFSLNTFLSLAALFRRTASFFGSLCVQGRGHMLNQPIGSREEVCWLTRGICAFFSSNSARQKKCWRKSKSLSDWIFLVLICSSAGEKMLLLCFKKWVHYNLL